MQISYKLNEIDEVVKRFWQHAHKYSIICFYGEMGAGKTTFISALCKQLGADEQELSSPTFSIINEYAVQLPEAKKIFHMDWYRLRDEEEAMQAGVYDALSDEDAVCFIEWPEKCAGLLPDKYMRAYIREENETERTLSFEHVTSS